MLPHRFQFHRPELLDAAIELLDRYGDDASPYAGGTELLLAMKARVLRYEHLIDLKRIRGLADIEEKSGAVWIGALATHHAIAHHPLVRRKLPALARLADNIANIRVRVAGTLGGNLCFAEPHADPPALLCAMGASVRLQGPDGVRELLVEHFITSEFTTERASGEILTAIQVPVPAAGSRFAYRSFGHLERPAVGLAAARMPDGSARIWCGAIADRPTRLPAVEAAASGRAGLADDANVADAARTAAQALDAKDDLHGSADYKRHLCAVLIGRALADVAAGAQL